MFNVSFKYFFFPAVALGLAMLIVHFVFGVPIENAREAESTEQTVTGTALIGGDFSLTNQFGKVVTNEDFRGKLMVVYFGFSHCPQICPTDLGNISAAMQMLTEDERADVQPIFITIDPARDTVAHLSNFMSAFDASFQALTGTQEEVDRAIKAYRIYAKKVQMQGTDDYMMDHSTYTYLMGRDGLYIQHFRHDADPHEMVKKIRDSLKM